MVQAFKISTDPLFVEKVRDVVGLYLDPLERGNSVVPTLATSRPRG